MKLIIELKDETYKFFKENTPILIARSNGKVLASEVYNAIQNGTLLPKGKWSQYSFHDFGGLGDWDYKCSKCNKVNGWRANFCPNCGADMRGGAE